MGSGKLIKRAIRKYNKEHFTKEILFEYNNKEEMNAKEKELVNEEMVKDLMCYNVVLGGFGGYLIEHKSQEEKALIYKSISDTLLAKTIKQKEMSLAKRLDTISTRTQEEQDTITSKRLQSFINSMSVRSEKSKKITSQRISDSWNSKTQAEQAAIKQRLSWFNNGIVAQRYTPGAEPDGFYRGRKIEKHL